MTVRRRERDCATTHKRRIERTKVAAVEQCRVVRVKQEQFVTDQLPAMGPSGQRTLLSIGVECPSDRAAIDVNDAVAMQTTVQRPPQFSSESARSGA